MRFKRTIALTLSAVLALGTLAHAAFTDVAEDAYYADAVAWAAEKNIALGAEDGAFGPDAAVTRAEAVTLLWRMAGEPEPQGRETFADVEADPDAAWYKAAVSWAVEQGVTDGTGDGLFSPAAPCSRGMILTMLYRMEGRPFDEAAGAEIPEDPNAWGVDDLGGALALAFIEAFRSEDGLVDVARGAYYELPIFWAALGGVLDANQVDAEERMARPEEPCPRGEMVYYLYRFGASEAQEAQ